jgi:hypothetical protein
MHAVKHAGSLVLGWVLVLGGLAALVLPGPGLLALFAGLALLSQHYEWARRRVEPVKRAAFRTAADGVQTWPRIALSLLGVCCLLGLGAVWIWHPPAPGWWPIDDRWWLLGGWAAGVTLVFSGLVALALVVFSIRHFRGVPDPHAAAEQAAQ